jgi:DNA-binding NarL/FixJ family response regulator
LKNGASGYVLKDARVNDLVQAVREVTSGRRYLSPPLTERAIEAYMHKLQTDELDIYETLTSRERELLQLAAEGKTNRETAELLSISPRTVEVHRASMQRKLNLKSQVDLVRYALKRGILPMDD